MRELKLKVQFSKNFLHLQKVSTQEFVSTDLANVSVLKLQLEYLIYFF